MESPITIFPNNRAEASLYRQLAKTLNNRIMDEMSIQADGLPKSKQQFFEDLSESVQEMKEHIEGKLHLQTAEELLDEL